MHHLEFNHIETPQKIANEEEVRESRLYKMGKKARFVKQLAEKNKREVTRRWVMDTIHQMHSENKMNKNVRRI